MTLAACYGAPVEPGGSAFCDDPSRDTDRDGYCETQFDCNEGDATVHDNAVDTLGDGIDQDCDGVDGVRTPDAGR